MANATNNMIILPVYGVGLIIAANIVGIVGNSLLIIAHLKDPLKYFKFPSSFFILTTAVVDLLISCSFILLCKSYILKTTVNESLHAFVIVFHSVSFFTFFSIAIERFCSVTYPFWHRVNITIQKCRYWTVGVWLICVISGAVQYVVRTRLTELKFQLEMAQIVLMWTMCVVTQCVYIACYISVKKQNIDIIQRKDHMNEATARTIQLRLKNENNFLVTIAIVCFIFALTTLPFATMSFTTTFNVITKESEYLFLPYYIWGLLGISVNSAINIFVYIWRLPKYRNTFKKLYCDN